MLIPDGTPLIVTAYHHSFSPTLFVITKFPSDSDELVGDGVIGDVGELSRSETQISDPDGYMLVGDGCRVSNNFNFAVSSEVQSFCRRPKLESPESGFKHQ